MMRSVVVLSLAILAVILFPAFGLAQYTLSLSTTTAHPGDVVDVYAQLNTGTCSGFDFTVTYDPSEFMLSNTDVSGGSMIGTLGALTPNDFSWVPLSGVFKIEGANYQSTAAPGTILDMKFHVLSSATAGSHAITIWPNDTAPPGAPGANFMPLVYDNNNQQLTPLNLQNGSITVVAVPEPTSIALLATLVGCAGAVYVRRRRAARA
jgi:hypothetical protein